MGQPGAVGVHILGQGPGHGLVNVLVGPLDDLKDLVQGLVGGAGVHVGFIAVPQAGGQGDEFGVVGLGGVPGLAPGGEGAPEVLLHHGGGAADQVAQVVGQVHVDGVDEQLVGEVPVGAEGEGAHEEEAQSVHPELLCQDVGVHHVALGLGHLAPVQQQPAVAEDVVGQGQAQAHQHGGPDDGMEADDLLAHKVVVRGPVVVVVVVLVVVVAQGGDVVGQGVHPHIHHVAGVKVHRHPPGEGGAGDAQILQPGLDEVVHHLVDPGAGLEEVGVFQQVLDLVGVLGQAEEVGLLLGVLDGPAAVGALAVHQLGLRPEGLAGLAVLAHVLALVDVPVFVHLFEDLLDGGHVVVVGGADEPVVGDVHQLPQVLHPLLPGDDAVHERLGGDAGLLGLVLNLLAVLVGAGEEHHVVALEPLVPGHGVGGHGAVGVADVELVRGVVDGGGDIELLFLISFHVCVTSVRPRGADCCGIVQTGGAQEAAPPDFFFFSSLGGRVPMGAQPAQVSQ